MPVTTRSQKSKAEGAYDTSEKISEHGSEEQPELHMSEGRSPDVQNILILVGSRKIRFNVQKSILLSASDFFKGVLKSNSFKEGKEYIVCLPEIEPSVFKRVIEWVSKTTTYENLAITENQMIISMFKTADYLLVKDFKAEAILDIAYRVSAYLQETYLKVAMDDYKNRMGLRAITHKYIEPKDAIDVVSNIYQYCRSYDMKHLQRCLLAIAAATNEVKVIKNDSEWDTEFTNMWDTAKSAVENAKTCRYCRFFFEKIDGCAIRMLSWKDQNCTCWRFFFETGPRYTECPTVGGMARLK
ncbi:hypothetical protein TWF706_006370 [Orbilia oligospora]|nr:hypothetical protein TWF706_006370 [Orbilia oligospora]